MTQMTVVDVANMVWPGQVGLLNIIFGENVAGELSISRWNVPNVEEPTIQAILDMIPSLQSQFDLWYFNQIGTPQLMQYLDEVAAQRQYNSAISCASYVSSTVPSWKAQADAFVSWRDSVFTYTIEQVALMQAGDRSVPTFEEFKGELPVINWP